MWSLRGWAFRILLSNPWAGEEDQGESKVLSPEQVIALLELLPYPVKIAVLLVASTGVRISECFGLKWKHMEWVDSRIQIQQTFRRGEMQKRMKTAASKAPVPMCETLAAFLSEWRRQTRFSNDEDFVFASLKLSVRLPLWGQTLNPDFVKPAALSLRLVGKAERFGWHCFRHSLSTWANYATKDITVSQTLLRHAKPDMTAVYTHGNFGKVRTHSGSTCTNSWRRNLRRRPRSVRHRPSVGLGFRRPKTTARRKWLCGMDVFPMVLIDGPEFRAKEG